MSNKQPYDPEDIESLMMHKRFNELYPEEKTFVLRHIASEEEYEHMRKTLQAIVSDSSTESMLKVPAHIKKKLMAEFNTERKSTWIIWLNAFKGWLWPEDAWLALRPALLIPVVIFCASMVWWYMADTRDASLLAEVKEQVHVTERSLPVEDETEVEEEPSSAERPSPESILAETMGEEVMVMEDDEETSIDETVTELKAIADEMQLADAAKEKETRRDEAMAEEEFAAPEHAIKGLDLVAEEIEPATYEVIDTVTLSDVEVQYTAPTSSKVAAYDIQEVAVMSESTSRTGTNLFQNTINPVDAVKRQNAQTDKAVLELLYTAY